VGPSGRDAAASVDAVATDELDGEPQKGPPSPDSSDEMQGGTGAVEKRTVLRDLFEHAHQFGFFQTIWLLQQRFGGHHPEEIFEVSPRRADARVRITADESTVFPASDVRRIQRIENSGRSDAPIVDVTATFMGLYGINAPLPSYFVEQVARSDEGSLQSFLDIFNHRIYSLFYRSWKKYRPLLDLTQTGPGRQTSTHAHVFRSLAGLGVHQPTAVRRPRISTPSSLDPRDPASRDPASRDTAPSDTAPSDTAPSDTASTAQSAHPSRLHWAAFAGRLSGHVRNREGLEALLSRVLDRPVRVEENVGRWTTINHRPTLGRGSDRPVALGGSSVVGARLYDVAGKFRIVVGPLDLGSYRALRPDGGKASSLRSAVSLYLNGSLDYDVKLLLDPSELQPAALGDKRSRVGSTARLGRPPDRLVSEIVAYDTRAPSPASL